MIGVMQFCKSLYLIIVDLSRHFQISFISCNSEYYSFGCMILQLANPFFNFLKALFRGDLICYDGSKCFSIIYRCDSIILFLSCCILNDQSITQMASLTF